MKFIRNQLRNQIRYQLINDYFVTYIKNYAFYCIDTLLLWNNLKVYTSIIN